jgi:hypothetical protein
VKQEKQEQKHDMCKTRIQQDFITRKKQKTKQGYDKKMYPKLVLNKLKVM